MQAKSLFNTTYLMRAVIQVKRASQVVMAGMKFDNTWLMESDVSSARANLVNLE